jgi:hypothetical protein
MGKSNFLIKKFCEFVYEHFNLIKKNLRFRGNLQLLDFGLQS